MIEIDNISKTFDGKIVLKNLSFKMEEGASYVITGESGCGKTTFLRIFLGLETADGGCVRISGKKEKHVKAGVVFQEDRLCEGFSAVENVAMVCRKIPCNEVEQELIKVLPYDSINKPVRELSGGMKRRVAIVRACIVNSQFLIMDEPFTGLDDANKDKVIKYILDKKGNKTLILTAHSLDGLDFCNEIKV